ncbi:MAG: hypothetical protein L6Q76_02085 [Polyangiaceae bacterium]|nr:hypothetical protein [Polyangiaceae bacterium]
MQAHAPCIDETRAEHAPLALRETAPALRETVAAPAASHEFDLIDGQSNWTKNLLAPSSDTGVRFIAEAGRFGAGLGLAAVYGLALGARQGGASLFKHAAGVPAGMIAVACLGVPALTILLTLFNAPLAPPRALSAASRAAAATGLVLGGLAPAAALFVVTSESSSTAAVMGLLGLAVAGVIGLRVLLRDLKAALESDENLMTRAASGFVLVGFAAFAVLLALRVWWSSLPILNGGAS